MPAHLEKVRDKLAENIHELWGMNKIELGWSYGKVRKRGLSLYLDKVSTGCRELKKTKTKSTHLTTFVEKSQ